MKVTKSVAMLLVAALLCSTVLAAGCATKRQLTDLDKKVDQAMSAAEKAQSMAADASAQVAKAQAAADAAEQSAQRAEAMADKLEGQFTKKMRK